MRARLTEMQDFGARSRLRLVLLGLLGCCCLSMTAAAMPGFTRQTGQPCVACHVGPLGSPLGPYGRQLIMGFPAGGGGRVALPVAFTLSDDGQNLGRVSREAEDQRTGHQPLFPAPTVFGVMPGSVPRPDGMWNIMPRSGFNAPFVSFIAPRFGETMANETTFGEATANASMTQIWTRTGMKTQTGADTAARETLANAPWLAGFSPVWRAGWQTDPGRRLPQVAVPLDADDGAMTTAAGASWRLIASAGQFDDDISARLTIVHDPGGANIVLPAGSGPHALDALRAEAAYRIGNTITPSLQYFRTAGTVAPVDYGWSASRPNSSGIAAQLAYAPWSGSGSRVEFLNLRFAAQYVAYTEYSATAHGPGGNSAVFLSLWGGIRF